MLKCATVVHHARDEYLKGNKIMEFDRNELTHIKQQISAGNTTPPQLVLHAAAALMQGRHVRRVLASRGHRDDDDGTVWRVLALLDGGLVSVVVGMSAQALGSVGAELDGDLYAHFIPLSEVTACAVTQILPQQDFGSASPFACQTRWALILRDGSVLEIPWRNGVDAHEAFAHEMVDLLSAR